MNKAWIPLCLLLLAGISLAGCSKPIEFTGKSAFWSVDATVRPFSNKKSFVIKYTGEDRQPVKGVRYAFENSKNFNGKGEHAAAAAHLRVTGTSTLDQPYDDETGFNVRIHWNDKEEIIPVAKRQ
ncbi:hypothetical protein SK3146_04800 [Paenibacillus konkukensis]|uniref:Lipoprotein n=1 Tax=Paenibacillus konkukensis TaxID=2020716 RepID=A0ABY4RV34_9BACL|nr:hypothetical protein [Paenibacillus konkukensis]UQZ85511.1 hypothetical protein SK3146_04800 [Paenibacillus konkukensis]